MNGLLMGLIFWVSNIAVDITARSARTANDFTDWQWELDSHVLTGLPD